MPKAFRALPIAVVNALFLLLGHSAEAQLGQLPFRGVPACDVNGDSDVTYADLSLVSWWLSEGGSRGLLLGSIDRSGPVASATAFFESPASQLAPPAGVTASASSQGAGSEPECQFLRGDSNNDTAINIGDGITILEFLFQGATPNTTLDAYDSNDSGAVDIADYVYLTDYLFMSGDAPPEPFSLAGLDRSVDSIDPECHPLPVLHVGAISVVHDAGNGEFVVSGLEHSAEHGTSLGITNVSSSASVTTLIEYSTPWQAIIAGAPTDTLVLRLDGPKGFSIEVFPDLLEGIQIDLGVPPQSDPAPDLVAWFDSSPTRMRPDIELGEHSPTRFVLSDDWTEVYALRPALAETITAGGQFFISGGYVREDVQAGVAAQLHLISGVISPAGLLTTQLHRFVDSNDDGLVVAAEFAPPTISLGSQLPMSVSVTHEALMYVDMLTGQIRRMTDNDSDGVVDSLSANAFYVFSAQEWSKSWVRYGVRQLSVRSPFELYFGSRATGNGGVLLDVNQDGTADQRVDSTPGAQRPIFWPRPIEGANMVWCRWCTDGNTLEARDASGATLGSAICSNGTVQVSLSRTLAIGELVTMHDITTGLVSNAATVLADAGEPVVGAATPSSLSGVGPIQISLVGYGFDVDSNVVLRQSDGLLVPCPVSSVTSTTLQATAPGGHPSGSGFLFVYKSGMANPLDGSWIQIEFD